jgi:hypothetical protein
VNALRTIQDILGTEHINLNTAYQSPMTEVFDNDSSGAWTFTAEASTDLVPMAAQLLPANGAGVRFAKGPAKAPTHDAAYWDRVTTGMNFAEADQVPTMLFNRVVWKGLKGNQPYPIRN